MFPLTFRDLQAPAVGSMVGPWLLLERLDYGSYGMVYRARRADSPDAPPMALKLARRPEDERFEREAELLRRLQHPSIPRFEDEGLWAGPDDCIYPYLVMELVQGLTLYNWMKKAPRSSRDLLRVLAQVARALAVTHAADALHRDVKGDNIRVTPEGRAVLLDWGSGWFSDARELTDTIVAPSTTAYRPPEQRYFMGRYQLDPEACWESAPSDDLYSLGVTLYRAVAGVYLPPCTEGGVPVRRRVVRPSKVATVCADLETFTMRLLSDDPEERGTAEQLAQEVQAVVDTAGPVADSPIVPIVPTAHAKPMAQPEEPEQHSSKSSSSDDRSDKDSAKSRSDDSSEEERRRHRRGYRVPIWLASGVAAMLGGLVGTYAGSPRKSDPAESETTFEASPVLLAEEWHEPEVEMPDAGVGDVALLSSVQPQRPARAYAMAIPMPKTPAPGQKKPPCEPEVEITALGACWSVLKKEPPCGTVAHEFAGLCVRAVFEAPRTPTSEEP